MNQQFHYVVFYDTETKKWAIDYDVSLNYDNGNVWDTQSETWEHSYDFADLDDILIQELNSKLAQSEQVSA